MKQSEEQGIPKVSPIESADVRYFGVWGTPGHYLVGAHGAQAPHDGTDYYIVGGVRRHVDATLAPVVFRGQVRWKGESDELEYKSQECPQGEFLLHKLSSGYTVISWWDRVQGDKRSNCNSTVFLKGEHDAATLLETLRRFFPTILANLDRAGVKLVQVFVNDPRPERRP